MKATGSCCLTCMTVAVLIMPSMGYIPMPASVVLRRPLPSQAFRPLPSLFRPPSTRLRLSPVNAETLTLPPPEQVLNAVEKAGGRVTAQDVAALSGIDLGIAQKGLVKLASLVDGDLEVSGEGDLVYNFPANFRAALRARSTAQRFKEVWAKIWPGLFYLLRVSFGLVLVLSIALIFTTILVAGSASVSTGGDRDDRRRDDRQFSMRPSIFFNFNPFDFFVYRPYGYYYYNNPTMGQRRQDRPEGMGFFESCFSYIFGDGDPNMYLDQERYQIIAQVIRRNGGAVVAEQLAPYLDVPAPQDPKAYAFSGPNALSGVVDESFVLPVLTQLNGRPEVTKEGTIVYVFPELMTSAVEGGPMDARSSRRIEIDREMMRYASMSVAEIRDALRRLRVPSADCFDKSELLERMQSYLLAAPMAATPKSGVPDFLEAKSVPFSVAPTQYRFFAGALGVLNLGGALALGNLLRSYVTMGVTGPLPGILGLSQVLYGPLLVYAIGFNVIPLVRSFWLKERNKDIERGNESRNGWAGVLQTAIGPLYDKILSARNYRSSMKVLRKEESIYSTAKSISEQAAQRETLDMREFEKRLEKGDRF